LSADEAQAGQLVRCPTCLTALRVPAAALPAALAATTTATMTPPRPSAMSDASAPAANGTTSHFARFPALSATGRRYGFNCPYCSSRLEANDAMAAQDGQCPTCGNSITIPIRDRYGRLIDPKTRQIIKQPPHPVHAYAAAGERAPRIIRSERGVQNIQCPRCRALSPINANMCKGCGMPFTMEGTTQEPATGSNGFSVASLVLGIIGIPAFCVVLPSLLAVIFGTVSLLQSRANAERGGRGMAIAGIICGLIGCLIFVGTIMG
jgi:hypothetical protein